MASGLLRLYFFICLCFCVSTSVSYTALPLLSSFSPCLCHCRILLFCLIEFYFLPDGVLVASCALSLLSEIQPICSLSITLPVPVAESPLYHLVTVYYFGHVTRLGSRTSITFDLMNEGDITECGNQVNASKVVFARLINRRLVGLIPITTDGELRS